VLEKELISQCKKAARAMGGFLCNVGQLRSRGSGTTVGFPDLVLICSGKVLLIEAKLPRGRLSEGQNGFIAKAADQHVTVHVITSVEEFIELVNACRR
jgi:hypothetical protein